MNTDEDVDDWDVIANPTAALKTSRASTCPHGIKGSTGGPCQLEEYWLLFGVEAKFNNAFI